MCGATRSRLSLPGLRTFIDGVAGRPTIFHGPGKAWDVGVPYSMWAFNAAQKTWGILPGNERID